MVIKKYNLKDTELLLAIDKKNIEKDIDEIINNVISSKKIPFHEVILYLPNEIEEKYLKKLIKNIDYKKVIKQDKLIIVEI